MSDATPAAPVSLTIEEAIEHMIATNEDHEKLLRETMRDNILVARTTEKLLAEYVRLRDEMATAAKQGSGPLVFSVRRILSDSEKRLMNFVAPAPLVQQVKS